MKRFPLFLTGLCMAAALSACHQSEPQQTPPQGMYVGTLPCKDCSPIRTAITFRQDGSAIETQLFSQGDVSSLSQGGGWTMDQGIVTVSLPLQTQYYRVSSPDAIVMTDSAGKIAADAGAYTLTKVKPRVASDFAGRYRLSGDAVANGYAGVLTIAGTAQDGVTVDISADGVEEGCTFNAHGKIINDQIEIPLQSANPGMNSTLVIRSDVPDVMNVSTSNAGDSEDLALFCSGGKTLAGDYVKAR